MNFPKTPDVDGLVFSPWELRPGTTVAVSYSYVDIFETTWNSDAATTVTVSGTVYLPSIQSDWPIPDENVVITPSGNWNIVDIAPINYGSIPLTVYYKVAKTESLTAVSAITEAAATYYNDWFYDETGTPTPMTVVPLTLPFNEQVYKPEDFTVTFDQPQRGISVINEETWTSDLVGTVKMTDPIDDFAMSRNLFRKGLTQVEVPMNCLVEPVVRYVHTEGGRTAKVVEMDLQDWDPNRIEIRGILWHRDKLYVMTENGLYRFDRWGSFDQPEAHYPGVTGYDLTYAVDDLFLVTDGGTDVKVYQVRHDYLHYDRTTRMLRFRETDPLFRITEGS